ncbi:hypothetical protein BU15DRAFT_76206 [Melanogaster broomeanus]|nr:hypothetical protein BU15DRAFT_76206 [Melanogaster broomeanus]
MSDSSEAAVAISLARGPLIGTFIGLFSFLDASLYGVTCLQAFFYFQTYTHDRMALKITVATLLALETAHAALSIWVMDDYLIAQYGNEVALQDATWLSTTTYIIGVSAMAAVCTVVLTPQDKFLIDYLVYL